MKVSKEKEEEIIEDRCIYCGIIYRGFYCPNCGERRKKWRMNQ